MSGLNKQKGITMWGILLIVLIGIFFLLLFFKLFPPYMEDAQVSSALDTFASSPDARNRSPQDVINSMEKRFDVDSIKNANPRKDIKIVPDGNSYAIELNYFVEIEMMGNVSVLLDFRHRVPVR